jgi:hypothetical protein
MKILIWASLTIVAAILALIVWSSARFVVAPRSTTNEIAGFNIPESARFVGRGGDSNNAYFKWTVAPEVSATLAAPRGATQLFDHPTVWHPFNLGFFGKLEDKDVAADAEALYYRTSFWDVALIRSKSERSLIVAGIYTN